MSRLLARPVLSWLLITLALAIVILVPILAIGNCGGGGEARELLEKASSAVGGMNSYHMTVSSYGENPDIGKVHTEELAADIDGDNIRIKDTFFDMGGQTRGTLEIVKIGNKQYTKDVKSDAWSVDKATLSEGDISAYTKNISDFLTRAGSSKSLGEEEINGITARHLLFTLSPQQVSDLGSGSSSQNFDYNEGGQVDIWIDPSTYYPVRYELVFKHIWVGSTSYADVQYVVNVTRINEPITITPPI